MDTQPSPPVLRVDITARTIFLVLIVLAAVWISLALTNVLLVLLVALILVGTIEPAVEWLQSRGLGRGKSLILVFVLLAIALAALLVATIPPLFSQLLELTTKAPRMRDEAIAWLNAREGTDSIVRSLKSLPVDDITARAGTTLLGYSTAVIAAVGYAITTLFLAIYLLADPIGSKSLVFAIVSRRHHVKVAKIMLELKVIVGGYMRGQLITSAAITGFVFVLLTVLRIDNALAIAIFAGVTDLIPFVGGLIASAPVVAAVAPRGAIVLIIVAGVMLVYQEFESRILVPRVYGRVLRLSPALVLVALLVGGTLMGILGALLALPVAAGIRMLVRELRVELPGATLADDAIKAQDERAEVIYEQLTEGATPADAAVIATDLARGLKMAEEKTEAAEKKAAEDDDVDDGSR